MQTFPVKICYTNFLFLPVSPQLFCSIPQLTAYLTNWQLLLNVLTVICDDLEFAVVYYFVLPIILFLNGQNLLPAQRDGKVVCIFEFPRK